MASAHTAASYVEAEERRFLERIPLSRTGTLRVGSGPAEVIRIADLHRDGCRIESDVVLAVGDAVTIGIPGVGQHGARVNWTGQNGTGQTEGGQRGYGCQFDVLLPSGSVTAAMTDNVHPFAATPASGTEMGVEAQAPADAIPAAFKWPTRSRVALLGAASLAGWVVLIGTASLLGL